MDDIEVNVFRHLELHNEYSNEVEAGFSAMSKQHMAA